MQRAETTGFSTREATSGVNGGGSDQTGRACAGEEPVLRVLSSGFAAEGQAARGRVSAGLPSPALLLFWTSSFFGDGPSCACRMLSTFPGLLQ